MTPGADGLWAGVRFGGKWGLELPFIGSIEAQLRTKLHLAVLCRWKESQNIGYVSSV
jgi:hypothetical protein